MTTYRLHYFPESGNSYKLALMLTLCGQEFEPIWTDFGGGVTRTAAWRESVNELGEIPVLEEDELRLTQTAPILLRLAKRYARFGGSNESEKFEILRWLFWDNHIVHYPLLDSAEEGRAVALVRSQRRERHLEASRPGPPPGPVPTRRLRRAGDRARS